MKDHLKTTWMHIRRTPYQALSAIGIMTLTFLAVNIIVLLAGGSQKILHYFETRPQITAFLKDEAKEEEIDSLKATLAQSQKVDKVVTVSKDEALEIYREQNKNDPLLLEMVTANILPASLEISSKDLSYLGEISKLLEGQSIVEEVVFQEDIVGSLKKWTTTIRQIGLGVIGFLSAMSVFIILIIIGMKVALRKEEVGVLELIGASRGYIKAPFILEGIAYGVFGAIVSWGISYLILLYSTPFLVKFLAGIPLLPVPFWLMLALLGIEMLAGIFIGVLGSFLAVKRYLK